MIEETWNWPCDKIQNGREYLHDLFSLKSFCICAKNQKINEQIEPSQNLNKNFPCKLFCYRNTRKNVEKMQLIRFSIVIVDLRDSYGVPFRTKIPQ